MSQVKAVRMNQQMGRSSGYEHILAMQQERQRAQASAREERPALAALGLLLLALGALAAVLGCGAFAKGAMDMMLPLAGSGITLLAVGLAMVSVSAPREAEPVYRRDRRYY